MTKGSYKRTKQHTENLRKSLIEGYASGRIKKRCVPLSQETKDKISKANTGKIQSPERILKTKIALKKFYDNEPKENKVKRSLKLVGHPNWKKAKYKYKEHTFRGRWEVLFAEFLDLKNVKWQYEPRRFYFKDELFTYLPDFYLPDMDLWIEVRGRIGKMDEKKTNSFIDLGYNLIIIEQSEINTIWRHLDNKNNQNQIKRYIEKSEFFINLLKMK